MVFVVTDTDGDASANVTRKEVKVEKLTAKGTANLEGLQEAIEEQKVAYVFPYSRFTFDVDLRFVVLCDGAGGGTVEVFLVLSLFRFLSLTDSFTRRRLSHFHSSPTPIGYSTNPPQRYTNLHIKKWNSSGSWLGEHKRAL
jgi:hypothetical protein